MKVFMYFFRKTLSYRIFDTLVSGYQYIKVNETIGKFIHSQEFKDILKKYLKIEFDEDWIGRIYGVINPLLDIDNKMDMNSVIVELDGDNTNNRIQVQNWLSKQLSLIYELFKLQHVNMENLFNEISIDCKHVGPKEYDNYLIILDLVRRQIFSSKFKKMLIHMGVYSILILIVCLFIL